MAKQKYRWFVYPLNSETNASFARELPEENLLRDIFCYDGITRTLWECPINLLRFFWESRSSSINFQIFNVCGPSKRIAGRIRECTFLFNKKHLMKPKLRTKKAEPQPLTKT